MNDEELKYKVNQAMHDLMTSTGVVAPVEVMQKVWGFDKRKL